MISSRFRTFASCAAIIGLLVASSASALPLSYQLNSVNVTQQHVAGPGLLIQSAPAFSNSSFILNDGGETTIDLFQIWTPEGSVQNGEDTVPRPFQVQLGFSQPLLNSSFDGDTSGAFFFVFQYGQLVWDTPVNTFITADRTFELTLNNATFNSSFLSLDDGPASGATVTAKIKQVSSRSVPDAGGTLILALFGFAAVLSLKRKLGAV